MAQLTIQQVFDLALQRHQAGRLQEAEGLYRQILTQQPFHAAAMHHLGLIAHQTGQNDVAIDLIRRAIAINPNYAEAYSNLGNVLWIQGRLDEAIALLRQAITLQPDLAEAHGNLGIALADKGELDEAIATLRQAIALNPNFPEAHNNLGNALRDKGQLDESIISFRQAIALRPGFAEAHNNLGNALKDIGQLDEAIAAFRRAIALQPEYAEAYSNLLYSVNFKTDCSPAQLLAEHHAWAERLASPLKASIRPHDNDRDPNRRLRIGYVSPDFRAHPVGRFLLPLLAAHDRKQFEIYCYSCVQVPDAFTSRCQNHADVWRAIGNLGDDKAADLIRNDRIDILVDLTMHMAGNRLLLFARKPAPVQATYLAYAGTTGLETIDYRITDPHLDPPGSSDENYAERSIRLAETYWCYEPPIDSLEMSPLPAAAKGFVTLGCLNNFCKITPETFLTWSRLLIAVPNSRLLLHATVGSHRDHLHKKLSDQGVDPNRLTFVDRLALPQYMQQYQSIDIGLDPFPYVGGTTTCDALWMGVPVVTLRGQTAISRGGASILTNIGISELIAESPEQYVQSRR